MQNKFLVTAAIVLLSVFGLQAQVNLGSPYSRYGIGNLENLTIGRSNGMGGISTGLRLPYEINPLNPASYSGIPEKVFLFQTGFKMKKTAYSDASETVTDYNFKLNSINAALSINKYWGMSFGMNPYSTVNYNITTKDSVTLGDYTSNFTNKYTGQGGITDLYFGNAFTYKGFSAGVNASYFFGPLMYQSETLEIESNFFSDVVNLTTVKIHDFHLRYGIQYTDSILGKYSYTVGGYYENKTDLNSFKTQFLSRIINSTSDNPITDTLINDTITNGIVQIPTAYGFGFSFLTKKFIFGADYKMANWGNVLFFNEKQGNLTNASTFAFGIEYTNDYTSKQFLKTLNWRLGGHLTNSELYINNTQIKDYGINFGVGIPTKLGAKLNLGFEFGQKGSIENDLVKENYFMVNFNINLGDRWFIRRRFF